MDVDVEDSKGERAVEVVWNVPGAVCCGAVRLARGCWCDGECSSRAEFRSEGERGGEHCVRGVGLASEMGKPRPALPYHEANKQGAADILGAHQGGLIGWRKKSEPPPLGICGGGLAGCLAAVYLARRGERVDLYEFRPVRHRPAPLSPCFA